MALNKRIMGPRNGDPYTLLGVYKTEADVPSEYRLPGHPSATSFDAEESWWQHTDYMELADSTKKAYLACWNKWEPFTEDRGRNPAFPTVEDVEQFLTEEASEIGANTLYNARFKPLYRWFKWLMWHGDAIHRYNPVVMAVCQYDGAARSSWIHARTGSAQSFTEAEMEGWQNTAEAEGTQ
jgi:hypothetical protein